MDLPTSFVVSAFFLLVIPAKAGIHSLFFGKQQDQDGFRLSPE